MKTIAEVFDRIKELADHPDNPPGAAGAYDHAACIVARFMVESRPKRTPKRTEPADDARPLFDVTEPANPPTRKRGRYTERELQQMVTWLTSAKLWAGRIPKAEAQRMAARIGRTEGSVTGVVSVLRMRAKSDRFKSLPPSIKRQCRNQLKAVKG